MKNKKIEIKNNKTTNILNLNNVKKLIVAGLIVFSGQLFANTTGGIEDIVPVKKQIETLLNTSNTPVYQDVIVMVEFKLSKNDKIVITSIASNEYEIRNFIRTSLNDKVILIDKSSNARFYSIPVRFIAKDIKNK